MSEVTDVQDLEQFIAEYKKNKQDDEAADIRYMSVAEYAEQTQRSPVTVRVMCQNGKIKGAVKFGKLWRIPVKESSDMQVLKSENTRLKEENAALRERLGCVKALLDLPGVV